MLLAFRPKGNPFRFFYHVHMALTCVQHERQYIDDTYGPCAFQVRRPIGRHRTLIPYVILSLDVSCSLKIWTRHLRVLSLVMRPLPESQLCLRLPRIPRRVKRLMDLH
jgi:hypothetical protein